MAPLVLEKTAQEQLVDAYAQAQGPFPVSIDGQQDFVMMSAADFEEYCEPPFSDEEAQMIREDYESALRGEVIDAKTAIAQIRAQYGL